ncbi:response regulator [Algoriphagus zhangzhouensis]|uniref:Response regulator receiver domain-containing protein n=1 Tax=Algoriphagus zhangzhouensis TaxID=1073327 RepID=A0A1M7ZEJ5_9BACT|nr:response regulator [Algoriphagus zhangzhouensis]TDY46008.1 response regulator receiver domain-containing protein [Algoriphagus zhangzhouensis]SHO63229.1 Response regulator receiver domain-containing protein [Algoriphagus zhangzhouensis]
MTIVYLDDDKIQHLLMKKLIKLNLPGSTSEFFENAEELNNWLQGNSASLILSDLNLEGGSGWDFVEEFISNSEAPIVFITGHVSSDDLKKSSQYSRVKGVLEKPLSKENWELILELVSSEN